MANRVQDDFPRLTMENIALGLRVRQWMSRYACIEGTIIAVEPPMVRAGSKLKTIEFLVKRDEIGGGGTSWGLVSNAWQSPWIIVPDSTDQ